MASMMKWGFWSAIGASALVGGLLALIFGLLAFRATGLYFGLATLALGQLVNILIEVKLRDWTGGSDGMSGVPRPVIFGYAFDSTRQFLVFSTICFAMLMVVLAAIRASSYGQVLRAVRDNPVRAAQLGYDVTRYRLSAFSISGAVTGISGALMAALTLFVSAPLQGRLSTYKSYGLPTAAPSRDQDGPKSCAVGRA